MDWQSSLITDPWFYAAAVPAVLLMGLSKSGFGAGFGSLAVPIMALTLPVPQAAAIMLPLLAVMDTLGVAAYLKHVDRGLIRLLLPAGLLGTVVGTLLFGVLPAKAVAAVVGALTLLFLAQRLLFPPRPDAPPPPRWLGALLGVASGFTSFVAHAGGPPISAYVLPLRLPPLTFSATMAVFFAAVNASKWLPYAGLGLIDLRNMATALVLMPLAPVGVWAGVRLVKHVRPAWFYRLIYAGMLLTGLKLLWDGLH
ncbi:sulfite exporter TauE/SafE family protein [Aquabacterium sp. A7-Y]|uniref:sulfite exporter TauE/SafE family protein n=1 Tax=Aquabacterium sp. A7-Y TaxID=1349605 RepID=UPI00223DBC0A|nr:sulfite exporter TauE/SafE family protein [Aquabacterium sp. A7-Y]MCW7538795.1 sulfite exporter TauE/SafE family protein [Aquabacterium sp. A7-Y]